MIITISGMPGAGKSTVAKLLAKELRFKHFYMGQVRRDYARGQGITLQELNKIGENDPTTDTKVDEYQRQLAKDHDNFIIEGRTSYHFIPKSFKLYLDVKADVGARRVFEDMIDEARNNLRNEGSTPASIEEVKKDLKERVASDRRRYAKWYGIDCYDQDQYDLVIDTTKLAPEEVVNMVLLEIKRYAKEEIV